MKNYDVVIVGASFSGLTLAHHLPKSLSVLVVDAKPEVGSTVESTGLITTKTYEEFETFFDIEKYITNPITSICVVAPNFKDYFVSETDHNWIFQTDTKALVGALAYTTPDNIDVQTKTVFLGLSEHDDELIRSVKIQRQGSEPEIVKTRFLVGADGSRSKVAAVIPALSQIEDFLFGYEQVFFGDVTLGPHPAETIYHFWFGEFSLGYGGWLSPTIVDGRKAFRIGLAKLMKDRGEAKDLTLAFMKKLDALGYIKTEGSVDEPGYTFGSFIPIGGVMHTIHDRNALLIGDAAGFCGAFAADGIKGSVISGKEAAKLISNYLEGKRTALGALKGLVDAHGGLMRYYKRQMRYRFIWDQMKRDRTFRAMYKIIEAERDSFLDQFCDSKDKHRSLSHTVLKVKHIPKLIRYSIYILFDMIKR